MTMRHLSNFSPNVISHTGFPSVSGEALNLEVLTPWERTLPSGAAWDR